eukprot:gene14472-19320_t
MNDPELNPDMVKDDAAPAAAAAAPEAEAAAAAEPAAEEPAADAAESAAEAEAEAPRLLTKKEKEKLKKQKEKERKAAQAKRKKEAKQNAEAAGGAKSEDAAASLAAPEEASADGGGDEAADAATAPEPAAGAGSAESGEGEPGVDPYAGMSATQKKNAKKKEAAKRKKAAEAAKKAEPKKKKAGGAGAILRAKLAEQKALEEAAEAERQRLQDIEDDRVRKIEEEEKRKLDDKERKKKEKADRIAAEKAAGTYLTAAQKKKKAADEAKAKAMMESMGMDLDAMKKDKIDHAARKKAEKAKKAAEETKKKEAAAAAAAAEAAAKAAEEAAAAAAAAAEESDDGKEDWEDSSDDDDDEEKEDSAKKAAEEAAAAAAKAAEEAKAKAEAAKKAAEKPKKGKGKGKGKGGAAFVEAADMPEAEEVDDGSAAADYGGVEVGQMRSPIICVLGHVDTGKTKILDKIRRTSVQDGEAGGITQQIGASYFPGAAVKEKFKKVRASSSFDMQIPGILVMDTPGHESFSNLRSRGSALCNMAILVVDIMHGLEPQTIESLDLLKSRKTPFVIALNKIDRLNQWKATPDGAVQACLKKQKPQTQQHFEILSQKTILQINEQGLNCALYYENKDHRSTINIVPTSAHTGEGIPDLLFLLCKLTQTVLYKQLEFTGKIDCTCLEVKKIDGHGTTIDVILADGVLNENDLIVCAGLEGPIITRIRSLLMPEPLKELRVKNAYRKFKSVPAANGIKIAARNLEKAVAGLNVFVARDEEHAEELAEEVEQLLAETLDSMKTVDSGVCVQASTLGSLEALLVFLKEMKIPVSGIDIGTVSERTVKRCSVQLEREAKFALILAFDVAVERDAQRLADRDGVKIFTADIIYHLFDAFQAHVKEENERLRREHAAIATFPCKLRIMPEHIFNKRDPIVVGVQVLEGILKIGTPITVPSKEFCDIGVVMSIQVEHEEQEIAKVGQEVCIKIDPAGGDKKLLGRHFDESDTLVSRIKRESIDAVKKYFRDDLTKADWRLMKELKGVFQIM